MANLINGDSPRAIAKSCAKLNIPFVHISTDYVFNGAGKTAWKITDTPNPKNAYGRSKLKGEEAIKASGCVYVILRTSWVISCHGSNFIKTMLRLSGVNETLKIVDDQIGGPTPARDIAHASMEIALQLMNEPQKSGVFHFSGAPDVSWCEFANEIFSKAGKLTTALPIKTSEYSTKASRPLNSRLDCSSTESTFSIPRPNWRDGLEEILRDLEITHETA